MKTTSNLMRRASALYPQSRRLAVKWALSVRRLRRTCGWVLDTKATNKLYEAKL